MDPITLATAATSLLAPFIKKAGDTTALERLAEQLPDAVGKVWNAISNKSGNFMEAASDLAQDPDDADNEVYFRKQLQKAFEKDQDFASLLTDLLEKTNGVLPTKNSTAVSNNRVVANNNNVAIGKFSIGGNVSGNIVTGSDKQVSKKPPLTHLDDSENERQVN